MTAGLVVLVPILLIAGLAIGIAAVAAGHAPTRLPKATRHANELARHLNGDAQPPSQFVDATDALVRSLQRRQHEAAAH